MNNWISVKDRLPDCGKYLVCCRDKDAEDARDIEIAWYDTKYIGSEFEFDCWSDPYDEIGLNCRGWVVTHWQPLPPLPAEQKPTPQELNEKRNAIVAELTAPPPPKPEYVPISAEEKEKRRQAILNELAVNG